MGWEAEVLSAHISMTSYRAPWLFPDADDGAQARRWIEHVVLAHIAEEVPRTLLAGYVRRGIVETVDGKQRVIPTSIRTSIRYSADDDGVLRWADEPPSAAPEPAVPSPETVVPGALVTEGPAV